MRLRALKVVEEGRVVRGDRVLHLRDLQRFGELFEDDGFHVLSNKLLELLLSQGWPPIPVHV